MQTCLPGETSMGLGMRSVRDWAGVMRSTHMHALHRAHLLESQHTSKQHLGDPEQSGLGARPQ